jgi:hypothetical protein
MRSHFAELDPGTKRPFEKTSSMYNRPRMVAKELDIDLDKAIKAEMSIEYWGGHIGTSEQKFKVNGNEWIQVPQPTNTPGSPQCYYRTLLGYESVEIPLANLRQGSNSFQFTCGPQICYSFDWGFYWIYAFTVRVYYDASKPHPQGRVTHPASGSSIGDEYEVKADASSPNGGVRRVDFIGYYEDFDWEGNGIFRQWHYQTENGFMKKHIGGSNRSPFAAVWHSKWLPDQPEPIRIVARITDESGMSYITQASEDVKFVRDSLSVKMYKPYDVPERFGVRVGNTAMCKLNIPDALDKAKSACLVVSSWSGKNDDGSVHEIRLNGRRVSDNFGRFHDYSYDLLHVPLDYVKAGINEVAIYSEFSGHALEINWPGPVLLIEYEKGQ